MLAYFLKVNVAIVLFYAFYRLFFYKDTFFSWRRTALLCFFAISAVYPLFNIQTWIVEQEPIVAVANLYANILLPEAAIAPQINNTLDWENIIRNSLSVIYWGGVVLLIIHFLIQLAGIIRLALRCRATQVNGITIHLLKYPKGPFSFFRYIFVHPASHTEEELNEIITHEQTHVRQWHSIDVLISELICIFCWFNPFVWLIKREIRTNLEYMADAHVLANGYDSKTYQYHLLGLSHHKAAATIYNNFNVLPLKKRIKMMNKKRTKEIGRTKYVMFLPLAALLMIISNIETVARTTKQIATDIIENVTPQTAEQSLTAIQDTTITSEPIFEVVEKMPKFPGGMQALMKYLDENINYPETAKAQKIEGRVFVQFVVNPDGSVGSTKVLQGITPALDAEAIRVISSMPKWNPGTQRGKNVRVRYTLPVSFSLEDSKKNQTVMEEAIPKEFEPDANGVFEEVEQMPEFPGGINALIEYLRNNIKYPVEAQQSQVQGRVIVEMVVDAEGNVTNAKVIRGIVPVFDKEAIRVIEAMPKWKPGMQKGKAVPVRYTVPIMFSMNQ